LNPLIPTIESSTDIPSLCKYLS